MTIIGNPNSDVLAHKKRVSHLFIALHIDGGRSFCTDLLNIGAKSRKVLLQDWSDLLHKGDKMLNIIHFSLREQLM